MQKFRDIIQKYKLHIYNFILDFILIDSIKIVH